MLRTPFRTSLRPPTRRRLVTMLVLVTGTLLGACTSTADNAGNEHESRRPTRNPATIRAVWVDSWGEGFYDRTECDALLAWCRQARVNTIIVEVRKVGDAYYVSDLEPAGIDEATKRVVVTETFDPLAYLAERITSDPSLRLEAWIVANRIWKGEGEPPISTRATDATTPRHVIHAHPEWLLRDDEGRTRTQGDDRSVFLDPSDPSVREWNARVAADLAARYDVDAIHLDYIRYPGNEWGYGAASLSRFRAATGRVDTPERTDPEFIRWRADQVTEEVRVIRDAIHRVNSDCDLTAALLTWGEIGDGYETTGGYVRGLQDWPRWCREGLVDVAYFMHYKREYQEKWKTDYRAWFPEFHSVRRGARPRLVIGQGSYLNAVADTGRQLEDALAAGFDGFAVFSYRSPARESSDRATLAETLGDIATR